MAKKQFETGCCPRFNPAPWQDKQHKWKNKLFIKDSLTCLFYMPLGMDQKMAKLTGLMNAAGAKNKESIMLMDCHLFSTGLYIAVDKPVPGAQMTTLSGTYLSRVFEGGYSKSGTWAKEMGKYVASKGKTMKKLYFSYTTCPSCAKAYGKNYVVLFAEV